MKLWRYPFLTSFMALTIAALSVTANAQLTNALKSALRSNCVSDFMAKCSGITPGSKEALVCLQKNIANLSPACHKVVSETMPTTAAAAAAMHPTATEKEALRSSCPSDFVTQCSNFAPDSKEALVCLQKNIANLSLACRKVVSETMPSPSAAAATHPTAAEKEALRSSCPSDFMTHCSNFAPDSKGALVCLQKNVAQLSPQCKKVVEETLGHPTAPTHPKAAYTPPPPAPAAPIAPPVTATPMGPTPAQLEAVKYTCRRDFRRYCRGVPRGGPEAIACLKGNSFRLTPDCKTSIAAIEQSQSPPRLVIPMARIEAMPVRERLAILDACNPDQAVLCGSVRVGGGRLIACLAAHRNALSPYCRRTLDRALR